MCQTARLRFAESIVVFTAMINKHNGNQFGIPVFMKHHQTRQERSDRLFVLPVFK